MTRTDWLLALLGAILVVFLFWAFTVTLFAVG